MLAPVVQGGGSALTAVLTRVHDNRDCGLFVAHGGSAALEACQVWSQEEVGVYVSGFGSTLIAKATQVRP